MMSRSILVLCLVACASACAPQDDCDAMCSAAVERFGGCITDAGMEWGSAVGYTSEADFGDWCATWVWEQREVGNAEQCTTNLPVLEDGTCADYPGLWAAP